MLRVDSESFFSLLLECQWSAGEMARLCTYTGAFVFDRRQHFSESAARLDGLANLWFGNRTTEPEIKRRGPTRVCADACMYTKLHATLVKNKAVPFHICIEIPFLRTNNKAWWWSSCRQPQQQVDLLGLNLVGLIRTPSAADWGTETGAWLSLLKSGCNVQQITSENRYHCPKFIRIHYCSYSNNGTSDWSNHSHVMQTIGCSCRAGCSGRGQNGS